MLSLPRGWDYGRDGPAMSSSVVAAKQLVRSLSLLPVDSIEVVPGFRGTVTVAAVMLGDELEVTCRTTGLYDASIVGQDGVEIDVEKKTFGDVLCLLRERGWTSIRLFGSCTLGGTFIPLADFQVKHLNALVTGQGFPSLTPDVSTLPDVVFVNTSEDIMTHPCQENHPSSGEYKRINFLRAVG